MASLVNMAIGIFWFYMAYKHPELNLDDTSKTLIYISFGLIALVQIKPVKLSLRYGENGRA